MPTLADLFAGRGLARDALAYRVCLNSKDRGEDFLTHADLAAKGALLTYARMQDGMRLGADSSVLLFAAEPDMRARLHGFYRFRARRPGVAPGDIVYDYDAAHLLHSFIARVRRPIFYDAFEVDVLADLAGSLVVHWPKPAMNTILAATDPRIRIV